MFDYLSMQYNYENRKIERYETEDLIVDTCAVTDSKDPYETAISSIYYSDNRRMIVVATYSTYESALEGHGEWVRVMTGKILPRSLADIGTSVAASLLREIDPERLVFSYEEVIDAKIVEPLCEVDGKEAQLTLPAPEEGEKNDTTAKA